MLMPMRCEGESIPVPPPGPGPNATFVLERALRDFSKLIGTWRPLPEGWMWLVEPSQGDAARVGFPACSLRAFSAAAAGEMRVFGWDSPRSGPGREASA